MRAIHDSQQRHWIKPYYRSFNGLRGLAVFLVFNEHAVYLISGRLLYLTKFVWAGVDVFFVLSGFLITGILLDSIADPHFFRNFYVRRALRIFPVFYGFFFLLFLLTPLLKLHYPATLLTFFFYVGNIATPFLWSPTHNPTMISWVFRGTEWPVINIGVLWSLCVEEQFYLIWPAVVYSVRNHLRLRKICVGMGILALILRCITYAYSTVLQRELYIVYWTTWCRYDTLLIGAWLALYLRDTKLSRKQLRTLGMRCFWCATIVLALFYAWQVRSDTEIMTNPWLQTVGYDFFGLASAGMLLLALDEDGLWSRFLQWKPLAALGVISYGFYFLHGFPSSAIERVFAVHHKLHLPMYLGWLVGIYILAWLSFRYYESRFLKLKEVLAPQRKMKHVDTPAPVA